MQTGRLIDDTDNRRVASVAAAPGSSVETVYVLADLLMGGAQTGLVRLVALGFVRPAETALVVLGPADEAMLDRVRGCGPWAELVILAEGSAPRRWATGALLLARLLRRLKPRLVVLSLAPSNLVGRLVRPCAHRALFCTFEHNSRYPRWPCRVLLTILSPAIDAVLYDSAATRAGVERYFLRPPRAWIEVPLFVIDPSRRPKARYGTGQVPRLLSVGRLVRAKGQALLLEVISELARRGVRVSCEIVGDGPLRGELERRCAALELAEWVKFVGQDPDWETRASAFDIYVQTSEYEGACLTILEAMQAGLPVVATAVGEIPRHLAGGAGITVANRDPVAFADAIEALLHDESKRAALGRAARAKVRALYDPQEVRARLQRTVGELLGGEMPASFGWHRA